MAVMVYRYQNLNFYSHSMLEAHHLDCFIASALWKLAAYDYASQDIGMQLDYTTYNVHLPIYAARSIPVLWSIRDLSPVMVHD